MPYGYNGQILRVNLSQGTTSFYDPKQPGKAKSYYYALMGWDAKTGIPTPEKLQELGIE